MTIKKYDTKKYLPLLVILPSLEAHIIDEQNTGERKLRYNNKKQGIIKICRFHFDLRFILKAARQGWFCSVVYRRCQKPVEIVNILWIILWYVEF